MAMLQRKHLQFSFFWAHPESVLMSLVCSENAEERKIGVKHIKEIRKRERKSKADKSKVRYFKCPKDLNLGAQSICEFTDLSKAKNEPPVTIKFSDEELENLKDIPLDLGDMVCNTQAVEHVVPVVTKASKTVTSHQAREGMIFNTLESRKKNPNISSKKFFNPQ